MPGFCLSCHLCPKPCSPLHCMPGAHPGDRQGCSYPTGQMKHPLTLSPYPGQSCPITVVPIHFLEAVDLLYMIRLTPQRRHPVRSVCRQHLVQLIVWPPSKLSGHMPWKRRVRDWGEKGRLRGVWSNSTFCCLAFVFWQVTRRFSMFGSQYYHFSVTGGETEAHRRLYPAWAHQGKSGQKY